MNATQEDVTELYGPLYAPGHGVTGKSTLTTTWTYTPTTIEPAWWGRLLIRVADWLYDLAYWRIDRAVDAAPYTFESDG